MKETRQLACCVRLIALHGMLLLAQTAQAKFTAVNEKIGNYGAVVARSTDTIKDAIAERVTFYPQSCDIHNPKNIERNGFLVRYKDAKATILMCHGFMCNKDDIGFLRNVFPDDYNKFTFDFRAHGDNKAHQYCTLGHDEAYDVIAAAHFVRNHPDLKDKPLFVYGFSMGAVAAIEAQAKDTTLFDAMILDCPFDSSENTIKRGLERLKMTMWGYTFDVPGRGILQRYAFHPYVQSLLKVVLKAVASMDSRDIQMHVLPVNPVQSIATIKIPLFFIHCKNDKKVSVEAIKNVYNNAGAGYKSLWITNGRFHFDSYFYNPEKYTERVRIFLDNVLSGAAQQAKQGIQEDEDDRLWDVKGG